MALAKWVPGGQPAACMLAIWIWTQSDAERKEEVLTKILWMPLHLSLNIWLALNIELDKERKAWYMKYNDIQKALI